MCLVFLVGDGKLIDALTVSFVLGVRVKLDGKADREMSPYVFLNAFVSACHTSTSVATCARFCKL